MTFKWVMGGAWMEGSLVKNSKGHRGVALLIHTVSVSSVEQSSTGRKTNACEI